MKFHFKKVGDTFNLDEYNAMCYLLSKQIYDAEINLTSGENETPYGTFTLTDNEEMNIVDKGDGFMVRNNEAIVYIEIDPVLEGDYSLTVTSLKQGFMYSDGTSIKINPQDILDEDIQIENDVVEETQHTIKMETTTDGIKRYPLNLKQMGLEYGDWIKQKMRISITYKEPIIDIINGRSCTDEYIHCDTFKEIQQAISYAPENSTVKIRLKGNKTYNFPKQINIVKKHIIIEGGNYAEGYHSILDANRECRHFSVQPNASLHLIGCKLINGNSKASNITESKHARGGSIYIGKHLDDNVSVLELEAGQLTVENCIFENCTADRGGAIYNNCGKLVCNNVTFKDCTAEIEGADCEGCWGGAIMNESKAIYKQNTSQFRVKKESCVKFSDSTVIYLSLEEQQNLTCFSNTSYSLGTLKCIINGTNYTTTTDKYYNDNPYYYVVTVPYAIPYNTPFYFVNTDNTSTRLLKLVKEGNLDYVTMV